MMVECTYNTSSANSFIRGGFASKDEMCLVFLHYYPAANLAHCASRLSFQHVLLALGINVWPLTPNNRHLGLRIRDPWQFQNLTVTGLAVFKRVPRATCSQLLLLVDYQGVY